MSYTAFEYTDTQRLLAECKIELDIHGTANDIRLMRWIIEGANEMMTLKDYVEKTATLEICRGAGGVTADLPFDFVTFDRDRPVAVTLNGSNTDATSMVNINLTYTGAPFLYNNPYGELGFVKVEVMDGKLYFSSNVEQDECTISYLAINVSKDGVMKVPMINTRPIICYVGWKWGRATQMRGDIVVDYKTEYGRTRLQRIGLAGVPDSLQKQQLSRIMNNLLGSGQYSYN